MLKAPGAEIFQNSCGVVNDQKIFCSHQCSPEFSMNKFRGYFIIKISLKSEERTAKKNEILAPFPANCFFGKNGLKIIFLHTAEVVAESS